MVRADAPERVLAEIWKRQLIEAGRLVTDRGDNLQVIYPGRENRDRGPDFVDAIVSNARGERLTGDIEIHSKANDWRGHGHDRDPNYDRVILHVVWDGGGEVELRNGRKVTTLSLRQCLGNTLEDIHFQLQFPPVPAEPCWHTRRSLYDREVGSLLDEAGDERFKLKADFFTAKICSDLPAQILYRAIMGALGYTKNRELFEELADRLPLAVLEGICRDKSAGERILILKAMLLGKAGLLPGHGDRRLEGIWRSLGDGETMDVRCWRVFRVRPDNHPVRRLIGAAHLVDRFAEIGLLRGILESVGEAQSGTGRLEQRFMVNAHIPPDHGECTLIGRGRTREIVVNVILPFTLAWSDASSQKRMSQHAWALYRSIPKAGEYGITRDLSRLLTGDRASVVVNSARRQQGLIHIDKTFCRLRQCPICPLAVDIASGILAN